MKKLIKDLLYSKDNGHLEIARVCSLLAVLVYCGAVVWKVVALEEFDPTATGTGFATLFAGCAAWIFARQKMGA